MSSRPRRSKNGTPAERAAKAAATMGIELKAISRSDVLLSESPFSKEEFATIYSQASPERRQQIYEMLLSVQQPRQ